VSYTLFITLEAREETLGAYHWYEEQNEGLGEDLLEEIEVSYQKLCVQPLLYGFLNNSGTIRYLLTKRFPFAIIYTITGTTIYVISVRHTSRKPFQVF
jgi:hypothetical protein